MLMGWCNVVHLAPGQGPFKSSGVSEIDFLVYNGVAFNVLFLVLVHILNNLFEKLFVSVDVHFLMIMT